MRPPALSSNRNAISNALAGVGVLLFVTAGVSPVDWYPALQLFAGLALIAISHVLTPCQDQMTKWWKSRIAGPLLDKFTGEPSPSSPKAGRAAGKNGSHLSP
jgi:hypothetical protein